MSGEAKTPLEFYDVKAKKKFTTTDYQIVIIPRKKRGGSVVMAFARSPYTGIRAYKVIRNIPDNEKARRS